MQAHQIHTSVDIKNTSVYMVDLGGFAPPSWVPSLGRDYNYSLFAHIIVYQLQSHASAKINIPAKITGIIESVSNMQLFS